MGWNNIGIEILMGKTLEKIINIDNDELFFVTTDNEVYKMYHWQDCCEHVRLEEVIGDLDDLIGSPIIMAECIIEANPNDSWGSSTWTFYKLATNKGYVTLRWFGESNGCYSEGVDFELSSFKNIPKQECDEIIF